MKYFLPFSILLSIQLLVLPTNTSAQNEPLAPGRQLEQFLNGEFFAHLDRRREAYEQVETVADCERWISERKAFFRKQLGSFPERTPLNPQIVGELSGDGYRLQKILFESRPNHHVSGSLYLPESAGRHPAVLIPCGHSHNGKASGWYQRLGILLARNGMAALCYDPIGQGERYQALDPAEEHKTFPFVSSKLAVPHPRVRFMCTIEHTLMGQGCILLGSNVAQFRIWDGMRAIDYLQSRDDIIADKIGCTGNSGGGTLTSYLMALDERIVAAAPGCYLTTFRRLIETKGPQDAEQSIFGQVGFGMDQPDYVMMHAPQPTLILATTRDATFDIDGAWDLFRQSKRFYTRLGVHERVSLCEPDTPHGMYPQVRQATARWMHRWLLGDEKEITEFDWSALPDQLSDEKLRELSEGDWTQEELYCTPDGQVMLMEGEQSVFEINAAIERKVGIERTRQWTSLDASGRRSLVKETIGVGEIGAANIEVLGEAIAGNSYRVEHLLLIPPTEIGIPLRAFALIPRQSTGRMQLRLPATALPGIDNLDETILEAVRSGTTVVFAELRGIGSTEPQHERRNWDSGRFGTNMREFFLAYLNGDSLVGMRVEDIEMWGSQLRSRFSADKLELFAEGKAAIPALHAAALATATEPFSHIELRRMIPLWRSIVSAEESTNQLENTVHGALRHYELPDLIDLAGSEKVRIYDPVDVRENLISTSTK